ncbi:MAG: hypothetical protein A3B68_03970 [Candidatus Melainabacteria bacterium RIFCSPHIGHO2_02_FULL_34_12]|nr:MAG: hypothetical protein A3B68_03970 [Candidatus Melainabacteria bacterium RIFCSPHIGHO2_02_FULL_34_12]
MNENFDNLLSSINSLPKSEQDKLFNYLLYKKSALSQDKKELIEFMTASSERIKQWMKRTDNLIEKMDDFFNDLKKSA